MLLVSIIAKSIAVGFVAIIGIEAPDKLQG